MNKNIIKELRIGSYIAIAFYFSILLFFVILLYEGQLSSVEKTIIIGISFVIWSIFVSHVLISIALENIVEVLLKEVGELKAKIKNNENK